MDNDIWHYVALSYDSLTGELISVFDNSLVTATTTPGTSVDTNAFTVMIGGNSQKAEREWLGFVDEVAIYNDALTVTDIQNRLTLLDTDPGAIDDLSIAFWEGTQPTGTFANPAGWAPSQPGLGDSVVLGKGGIVDFTGGIVEISNLEVGSTTDIAGFDSDGPGRLNMQAGELTISGNADGTIGKGTTGEIYQTGGSIFFMGEDYELGEDANGDGKHTMTGGLLQIGGWEEDSRFDAGWFMTNDNSSGDDLSLGRERTSNPAETAKGVLDMSGDSIVRVSNDVFLDVGVGELYMTDNALMHVGDDFRAASADEGDATMEMSGSSNLKVEGRFSIADSWDSVAEVTISEDALVEVGRYLVVAGQDNLNESGVGVLNIEGNATISIGAFYNDTTQQFEKYIYRGDVDGVLGSPNPGDRVADEHRLYVGSGNGGVGSGTINQNGTGTTVSVGRTVFIGDEAEGIYNLRGGLLEVRGDAPVSGVDFPAGLRDDDGFTNGGGDFVIGNQLTGDGMLNIEGGELSVARDMVVGLEGEGAIRVMGDAATINIDGDFSFGGDFGGASSGSGDLEIVITGATHSVINVTGLSSGIPGDLLLFSAELLPSFGGGFFPAPGDFSSNPLEWLIIDYAGSRTGAFDALAPGLVDGSTNGVKWGVRYDDVNGEVYLQALEVLGLPGDFNNDGTVDGEDFLVWQRNPAVGSLADWQTYYGTSATVAALATSVPEPSSLVLLLAAGLFCAGGQRRQR